MTYRKIAFSLPLLCLVSATVAEAETGMFAIRATVPLHCKLQFDSNASGNVAAGVVRLGSVSEYCNAPLGYSIVVRYTAGSLRGATFQIGDESAVLDGSGNTVLSRSPNPRIRVRPVVAILGESGLDTEQLELAIIPTT